MSILNGEADAGKELFELPVMIKADVQGSEQALSTALRYVCTGLNHVVQGASHFMTEGRTFFSSLTGRNPKGIARVRDRVCVCVCCVVVLGL